LFNKTESVVGRNSSNHACQIFCFKVTVSLICPSRNNRGQKMIAPPTALYNHGPGLYNLTLRLSIVKPLNSENHGIHITYHSILFRKQFTLCIGYRTFQRKELSFIGSGRLLFPHEYKSEDRDAEDVEAFTCERVRKKNLSIFVNAQFFCLKCTVSNLDND
jgi:hypothetical protein